MTPRQRGKAEVAAGVVITDEFASVAVHLDTAGNGPRLRIEDLRGGRSRCLGSLELESLVWIDDEWLEQAVVPGRCGWR